MGKKAGVFILCILMVIPLLATGFTVGRLFLRVQGAEAAYEAFSSQSTQSEGVLLTDKGGNVFLVCVWENGDTHLISILPSASPKGETNQTFRSIYKENGIAALKKSISKSISREISGYLEVDFLHIDGVVDALDGVEIAGKTYTGRAFETYLTSQSAENAGAKAQQEAILAVGRRFCSAGFWKAQNALGRLLKIADTDLSFSALLKIGKKLIPALEGKGLRQHCLPNREEWEATEPIGMLVGALNKKCNKSNGDNLQLWK